MLDFNSVNILSFCFGFSLQCTFFVHSTFMELCRGLLGFSCVVQVNFTVCFVDSGGFCMQKNIRGGCVNDMDTQPVLCSSALWVHHAILALP